MASQASRRLVMTLRNCPAAEADLFAGACEKACVDIEDRHGELGAAALVDEGTVEVLCAWLAAARLNARVQVAAARLLRRLVAEAYGAPSPGRERARLSGAVSCICAGMRQHLGHGGVQRAGAACLLLLFRAPQIAEASSEAVDVLVAAMRVHSTQSAVNEACAGALRNLFMVPRHLDRGGDCLDALVAALRIHKADAHVVEHTVGALVNLAATDGNAQAAVEAGALEVLVPALESHTRTPAVCLAACLALHNLVWKWPDAQRAARAAGAVPVLQALRQRYSKGRGRLADADAALLLEAIDRVLHRLEGGLQLGNGRAWAAGSSGTPRSPPVAVSAPHAR